MKRSRALPRYCVRCGLDFISNMSKIVARIERHGNSRYWINECGRCQLGYISHKMKSE